MPRPTVHIMASGASAFPEHAVLRNGRFAPLRFPAAFTLIRHPKHGPILFDTGYSTYFVEETRLFPKRLQALLLGMTLRPEDQAITQLRAHGIGPRDVRHVIISHFHTDHVGGLRDFPNATFHFLAEGWAAVRDLNPMQAARSGFMHALIPRDFERRANPLALDGGDGAPDVLSSFHDGNDIFGDGSVRAVALPGHARGHMGLYIEDEGGVPWFLIADAAYTTESFERNVAPSPLLQVLMDDWSTYKHTLGGLQRLGQEQPGLRIIPCHCQKAFARYAEPPPGEKSAGL